MLFPTATPCRSHEVGTVLLGEITRHADVAETGVLELPEPCLDALEHQSDDRLLYGLLEGEHDRFVGGVAGLDLQQLLQADILEHARLRAYREDGLARHSRLQDFTCIRADRAQIYCEIILSVLRMSADSKILRAHTAGQRVGLIG